MTNQTSTKSQRTPNRLFFIMLGSMSWWIWFVTACLLAVGLLGFQLGFFAALAISIVQSIGFGIQERRISAFPVQLRIGYTLLLAICFLPLMSWLFWLPTIGTFALNLFGYCLMARFLSLFPWNRSESLSLNLLYRTFFSRPRIPVSSEMLEVDGCAGGLCSIAAQVRPKSLDLNPIA